MYPPDEPLRTRSSRRDEIRKRAPPAATSLLFAALPPVGILLFSEPTLAVPVGLVTAGLAHVGVASWFG